MPDYQHDLLFGALITPSSAAPRRLVEVTRTAEAAGLDLAGFQDHPYQPTLLDTWTLLSYLAASTDTIHLAPSVVNLPLRPPAVLARAARAWTCCRADGSSWLWAPVPSGTPSLPWAGCGSRVARR